MALALKHVRNVRRYGTVLVGNDRVVGFAEKAGDGSGLINGGVYIISRNLFQNWETPRRFSFEHDFLCNHVRALAPVAYVSDGYFIDIGVAGEYEKAQREIPERISL